MRTFRLSLLAAILCTPLVACSNNQPTSQSQSEPEPSESSVSISESSSSEEAPKDEVSVFVLTGQSNMEGQTTWGNDYLKNAMQTVQESGEFENVNADDYQMLVDGIETVRTSYYGCGYGEIYTPSNIHASNKTTPIDGQFENTKVGMGSADSKMGPELGAAYGLRAAGTKERPIYFIKAGISGSGFAQDGEDKINWNVEKEQNLYVNHLKPYTENCLNLIEGETGIKPTIRGFLWMQGESDSDEKKIPYYADRMNALLDKFKDDFKGYAKGEDGSNIAFIDALIYDNDGTKWGAQTSQDLNQVKMQNAADHDNYYCINTSWKIEGGMQLKTGSPGGDSMHYNTESSFRLGLAYADVILKNNLLQ